MPAPVPIQIRYGDNGVIGAAAAAAGAGGAFQRQKAMDMQLISQMLQNKFQASMQEDQQAHEDQLSNDAFAMQRANQPPQQTYFNMADQAYANDPGLAMKRTSLATAQAAGVQGPELAILSSAADNKHINAAYFETMADEMKKRAKTSADKASGVKEKNASLNSLGNIPDDQKNYLTTLANADDITPAQFSTKIHEMQQGQAAKAQQAEMEKKAIVQMGVSAVNDKINQAQGELKAMQHEDVESQDKELQSRISEGIKKGSTYNDARAAAVQGMGGKTTVEPTFMEKMEAGFNTMGIAGPADAWTGAVDTSGAVPQSYKDRVRAAAQGSDPMGLRRKIDMKNKSAEIANLMKSRDQLISTLGGVPSAATGQPSPMGITPVQVSTPEEAMGLPSGTTFMTPDGRIKVRP